MPTPNSEYWKQRFTQLEAAQNALGKEAVAQIEKIYRDTQKQIEGQISAWYERLAKNNNISISEARRWLKGKELKEFKWDVGEYIKYGQENAMNQMWLKELENASAKFHISRLEALNISIEESLQELYLQEEKIVHSTLDDVYKEGYYRTMFELQRGFSIGFDVAKVNNRYVEKVLAKPWASDQYNFSERIWKSKDQIINEAHKAISQNLLTGADPRKAIDIISKKLDTSKYNAGRLVMTEEAYFSSLAQGDCYKELGCERYRILATLDDRTSEICQSLDGEVYDMKVYQAGTTAPPFHVFCRSTTVPYFDDFRENAQRAARDGDGKTYYVDGDMRYSDWKATFVNKTREKPAPQEKPQAVPKSTKNSKKPIDKSGKSGIIKVEKDPVQKRVEALSKKTYRNGTDADFVRMSKQSASSISKSDAAQIKRHQNADGSQGGYVATHNYSTINSNMRGDNHAYSSLTKDDEKTIATLRDAIAKNKLDDNYTLVRYVNGDYLTSVLGMRDVYGDELDNYSVLYPNAREAAHLKKTAPNHIGKVITEKAFLSASIVPDKNIFKNKAVKFELKAAKGTNAFVTTNMTESECVMGGSEEGVSLYINKMSYNDSTHQIIIEAFVL